MEGGSLIPGQKTSLGLAAAWMGNPGDFPSPREVLVRAQAVSNLLPFDDSHQSGSA